MSDEFEVEDIIVDAIEAEGVFRRNLFNKGIEYLREIEKGALEDYELEQEKSLISRGFQSFKTYVRQQMPSEGMKKITLNDMKRYIESGWIMNRIMFIIIRLENTSPVPSSSSSSVSTSIATSQSRNQPQEMRKTAVPSSSSSSSSSTTPRQPLVLPSPDKRSSSNQPVRSSSFYNNTSINNNSNQQQQRPLSDEKPPSIKLTPSSNQQHQSSNRSGHSYGQGHSQGHHPTTVGKGNSDQGNLYDDDFEECDPEDDNHNHNHNQTQSMDDLSIFNDDDSRTSLQRSSHENDDTYRRRKPSDRYHINKTPSLDGLDESEELMLLHPSSSAPTPNNALPPRPVITSSFSNDIATPGRYYLPVKSSRSASNDYEYNDPPSSSQPQQFSQPNTSRVGTASSSVTGDNSSGGNSEKRSSNNGGRKKKQENPPWINKRNWRLGDKIGSGSFGEVFQAMNDKVSYVF
jgi:hypothetical protein